MVEKHDKRRMPRAAETPLPNVYSMPLVEQPKILVVNDDPASLLALTTILSPDGAQLPYTVIAVMSGRAALREVLQHEFAVIFLDVNMPGMDGYETAEAIRLRHSSASTPIIFVTAYQADELDHSRAYRCGAADFIFTPVIPQILQSKALVFTTLAAKSAQIRLQAQQLQTSTAELIESNKRLQCEVKERQSAEDENQAKDEFLAMLGHELRNPLSAIRTAAALMAIPTVGPTAVAKAKLVIERQSRHLTLMVDELLDLSRALSGKLTLQKHPFDLADVVRECLQIPALAEQARERFLNIELQPVPVHADYGRMRHVVAQLIENALKYTKRGGAVDLLMACDADHVVFRVRDFGEGITAELLPRLFNTFVQGHTTIDRPNGGLGIGLALAYKLTELHGGALTAHSDGPGHGSTFTVRLPFAANDQAACAVSSPT